MHLGVPVRLVVYDTSAEAAKTACRAAYATVARLEDVFSDWRPASELSRLCEQAGGPAQPVGPELFGVLQRAVQLAQATDGRFDPTVGPLVRLWRQARESGRLPDPDELAVARRLVDYRLLQLDPAAGTVRLARAGMRLDLGAIAKGYIVDQALATLREQGIASALIEAGGDMLVGDPPPGREGWSVSIPDVAPGEPPRTVVLANQAISTSGDTQRFVEIDGVRYSHIVDPRTGYGLTTRVAATVIAADALTSDGLATAACLLDEAAAQRLIAGVAGASLYRRVVGD